MIHSHLFAIIIVLVLNTISHVCLFELLTKPKENDAIYKALISTIKFSWTERLRNYRNMPFKVKIIRIFIYNLMYKHLYNMNLNLDVAFL